MKRKQEISGYLAGRADNKNQTPWANAPMTEAEWQSAGGAETKEQAAYWDGFFGGASDAMAAAQRRVNRRA